MGLNALRSLLESSPAYERLYRALSAERAGARVQVLPQGVPYTLSSLHSGLRAPMLVITPRPEDARRLFEQIAVWSGDRQPVLHFPETESLPFERLIADVETTQQRLATLARLLEEDTDPPIVVASAAAVAQKTVDRATFENAAHTLRRSDSIDVEKTLGLWTRMGYRFEAAVDRPGAASRRGGILDIFPVGSDRPARIDLWGDEVDSIRRFDQVTQRSTEIVDSVTIIPAQETVPSLIERDAVDRLLGLVDMSNCSSPIRERISEEIGLLLEGSDIEEMDFYAGLFNRGTLLEYFPGTGVVVTYRPTDIAEVAWSTDERTHELRKAKEARGELPFGFPSSYSLWSEIEADLGRFHRRLEILPWGVDDLVDRDAGIIPFSLPSGFYGDGDRIAEGVRDLAGEGHIVVACTSVPNRLAEILKERGVNAAEASENGQAPAPGSINILSSTDAALSEGCTLPVDGHKLIVLSDTELFGVAKQRTSVRRAARRRETLLSELNPGDYVVHVEHGIARFIGTGSADQDDGDREYIVLEYAAGDRLYVPMDHVDRVTPYIAPMDRAPSLTRLGTQEWKRAKERVADSTREMAAELLSLYAERELVEGQAVGPDTPWIVELEDSFPYEETPDQRAAIVDVKADMENSKPMDRLICGDVGYGKTEIAVRAAFKAVSDGKQVAVLVPTTVLAQQHYVTFTQRLRAYPVKVEVLSRFRTDREQKEVVEGVADGSIDICIGTHRLIQKDVRFKDLGLVVIDEEQRFGVDQKERLKRMRTEVDVLTMTATPIPRTLHLSLAGIRDMSTIESPPEERLPIQTYVSEFSDNVIREAIRREIDRQGQVFFLHNRVYNIEYFVGYIQTLVPEARVAVGHGQMPEDQLESTMLAFAEHEFDVLVCTTIIESGLDIPNVNTLIVNRADTFGLAQLYQLRGRVGRAARRAYAYLLIPPARSLPEQAEKRLKTMLAATELGAGFRIAMKDLEIRGAGNILGAQQSGHIHAVGFDLYTQLLGEAVEDIRGRRAVADVTPEAGPRDDDDPLDTGENGPTTVDLGVPANVPQSYIADLPIRLSIYHKIAGLTADAEVASMEDELVDRFGPLPWQVRNLLYVARLKISAAAAGVKSVRRTEGRIVIALHYEVASARRALGRALDGRVEIGHSQLRMELSKFTDGWETPLAETVEKLGNFRTEVVTRMVESGIGV